LDEKRPPRYEDRGLGGRPVAFWRRQRSG
jgi:hypothetical protein